MFSENIDNISDIIYNQSDLKNCCMLFLCFIEMKYKTKYKGEDRIVTIP